MTRRKDLSAMKQAVKEAATVDPWAEYPVEPTIEHVPLALEGVCGKVCYTSKHRAVETAHRIQNVKNCRLSAYWCHRCEAWHLTSGGTRSDGR